MSNTLEGARDWRAFWNSMDNCIAADEPLMQVGRTLKGLPVPAVEMEIVIGLVAETLELGPNDRLLDLCCGNGLATRPLAARCAQAVGVDYSDRLIDLARAQATAPNLSYRVGSAEDLAVIDFGDFEPTKLCMNMCLQHFRVASFETVLQGLGRWPGAVRRLCLTDLPDADLVGGFYDTPERLAEFHRRRAEGTELLGTWWRREEVAELLAAHGYEASFLTPDPRRSTTRYRFDVVGVLAGPRA